MFLNLSIKQIFKILFIFIEVQLTYDVVLVSGIQNIYKLFFRFFSIRGYYKILHIVPCAIQ